MFLRTRAAFARDPSGSLSIKSGGTASRIKLNWLPALCAPLSLTILSKDEDICSKLCEYSRKLIIASSSWAFSPCCPAVVVEVADEAVDQLVYVPRDQEPSSMHLPR